MSNCPNSSQALPFIQAILSLNIVVGPTSICNHELLSIIIHLSEYRADPQSALIRVLLIYLSCYRPPKYWCRCQAFFQLLKNNLLFISLDPRFIPCQYGQWLCNCTKSLYKLSIIVTQPGMSKRMSYGKIYCPDVRVYLADTILPADGFYRPRW
jgi:hypothetical protein